MSVCMIPLFHRNQTSAFVGRTHESAVRFEFVVFVEELVEFVKEFIEHGDDGSRP